MADKKYTVKLRGQQYSFTDQEGLTNDQLRQSVESKLSGEPKTQVAPPTGELKQLPTTVKAPGKGVVESFLEAREVAALPSKAAKKGLRQLAEFVPEPEVSPEFAAEHPKTAIAANIALGTPRVAAETLSEFAPTFIHPDIAIGGFMFKGAGKALSTPAGQKFMAGVAKRTPDWVKRAVTYKWGQPKDAIEAAEQARIGTGVAMEQAENFAAEFSKVPKIRQVKIGNFLKGKKTKLSKGEKNLALRVRDQFTLYGKELVELGALDAKTYAANVTTYLPRLYRNKEAAHKAYLGPKKFAANINRFLKRKDLPQDVRESLGEIMEAGYPTVRGLKQLGQAVNRFKMFKKLSVMPDVVIANEARAVEQGFTKMPTSKSLGALSGKYVQPEVARDMAELTKEISQTTKVWRKTLGLWKFGKVVLSPATHSRNIMTNSFWLDVSGVGHAKQAQLLPKAIGEIRNKGPIYQAARRDGLIGTELAGTDFALLEETLPLQEQSISGVFKSAINYGKKAANKAGRLYQAEEQTFKMMKYIDNLGKGMPGREAALEAEQWIFNYAKVPPLVEKLRQSPLGIPFLTYFSKAVPQLAKAVLKNPLGVYKYVAFFDALENVAQERAGLSDKDVSLIREQRGVRLIPVKRPDKKIQTLNVDFLTPWGEATQVASTGLPLPRPFSPSGPVFALNNALLTSYDPFTKRPIYKETDPVEIKIKNTTDYLGKALLPNLTPGKPGLFSGFRGGFHFQELADAFRGKPRFPKRTVKSVPEALLSTGLGLKTQAFSLEEIRLADALKKEGLSGEIARETARKLRHEGVTKEERDRLGEIIPKQIKKVFETPEGLFTLKPDIELLEKGIKKERK